MFEIRWRLSREKWELAEHIARLPDSDSVGPHLELDLIHGPLWFLRNGKTAVPVAVPIDAPRVWSRSDDDEIERAGHSTLFNDFAAFYFDLFHALHRGLHAPGIEPDAWDRYDYDPIEQGFSFEVRAQGPDVLIRATHERQWALQVEKAEFRVAAQQWCVSFAETVQRNAPSLLGRDGWAEVHDYL